MAKPFRLQTLLELAQLRLDGAARELEQRRRRLQAAEEKLSQLEGYDREYRYRLTDATRQGISVTQLRDFKGFISKLDRAIAQQREEVARLRAHLESAQRDWQSHRQKLNAYDTLSARHTERLQAMDAKTEQKALDEHARRIYSSRRLDDE